ncbi:TPA: hypothetical protein RZK55_001735, partial [Campylobacter jejuni]|nr:hypothetical protein [Campylobacter jejuni]
GGNGSNGVTIKNFTNSGTIKSDNGQGVNVTSGSTINNFTNNSSGSITASNNRQQAVSFQNGSSTTTFLNKGTLIGGSNAASVNLGTNNQNGVTIETFTNSGIIGNGTSKFGITVWGSSSSKS